MKYLIASDIDRTLIKNSKSDISDNTKNIIGKLRNKNNIFVIASGRPLKNIKRFHNNDFLIKNKIFNETEILSDLFDNKRVLW